MGQLLSVNLRAARSNKATFVVLHMEDYCLRGQFVAGK